MYSKAKQPESGDVHDYHPVWSGIGRPNAETCENTGHGYIICLSLVIIQCHFQNSLNEMIN